MAKNKKKKSKQQPGNHVPGRSLGSILGETGYFWPGIGALVLIAAALFFWWIMRSAPVADTATPAVDPAAAPAEMTPVAAESTIAPTPRSFVTGRANTCQAGPRFATAFGFQSGNALIGTSVTGYVGLVLVDRATGEVKQHDTWDDAGNLGSFVYDGNGNIYTSPAPFINTTLNPPEAQNKIYIVNTNSGDMIEFVDLPPAAPMTENNPFGVLGLFYDCDTNSLYAGSVAGSTATDEVGRIFRVDVATGEVVDTLEGVDAMGVGVFNMPDGSKRLYFGAGRDTGIRSIALDENGDFTGAPRDEFFLAQFEGSDNDKGQRITFTNDNRMVVKGIDFNYTLRAASEPRRNLYTFALDPETAAWQLQSIEASETP